MQPTVQTWWLAVNEKFPASLLTRVFEPSRFRSEVLDAAAFLRSRVRLYIKTLFVISTVLTVAGWVGVWTLARRLPEVRAEAFYSSLVVLCALPLVFGVGWAVLRGWDRNVALVSGVESVCSIAATTAMATTIAFAVHVLALADVLLVVTLVLVTRASFVPSSTQRTLFIGLFSTASLSGFAFWWILHNPRLDVIEQQVALACLFWGVTFSVVTALLSRVLYGLHETVRSALHLGNYTLEQKLGQGGMAEVYLARHALLRRPTVVKLLAPQRFGEATVARFEREVQDTAALIHPNIVEIYDYGHTPEGIFYYAMEYVDGLNIAELVEQFGAPPPGRIIYVLSQVAHALGHAHASGMIHRDVKPGNILVSDRGGVGDAATLLDFGLVKELRTRDDGHLTTSDSLLGTPQYMAPESITGRVPVGPGVDLYALGAVAYYMLTGTDVFEGNTVVEVCSQHLDARPPAPSERAGRQVCSSELEQVILRCLEKAPTDRFADALSLRAALLKCPEAQSWNMEDSSRWWAQHRAEVAAFRRGVTQKLETAQALPDAASDGR